MTETATAAPSTSRERVGFSAHRVSVIAVNTLTEAVRQKVFILFLLIGLVFIASAIFFAHFSFGEQMKFIKDTCLGVISVISTLIAIVGTANCCRAKWRIEPSTRSSPNRFDVSSFCSGSFAAACCCCY